MFCVIYEFTVQPRDEILFKDLWHTLTLKIRESQKSLGSRLHKVIDSDNTWVAYAEWPSKEIYDQMPAESDYAHIRQRFLNLCESIKILYQMESVDDLLSS